MKVTLNTPKEVVKQPEVKETINEVTIQVMTDNPTAKKVAVMTKEFGRVVLWEGDAYDTIGQWTDTDVLNRLNELYNS